jgi:hypothetical protein
MLSGLSRPTFADAGVAGDATADATAESPPSGSKSSGDGDVDANAVVQSVIDNLSGGNTNNTGDDTDTDSAPPPAPAPTSTTKFPENDDRSLRHFQKTTHNTYSMMILQKYARIDKSDGRPLNPLERCSDQGVFESIRRTTFPRAWMAALAADLFIYWHSMKTGSLSDAYDFTFRIRDQEGKWEPFPEGFVGAISDATILADALKVIKEWIKEGKFDHIGSDEKMLIVRQKPAKRAAPTPSQQQPAAKKKRGGVSGPDTCVVMEELSAFSKSVRESGGSGGGGDDAPRASGGFFGAMREFIKVAILTPEAVPAHRLVSLSAAIKGGSIDVVEQVLGVINAHAAVE